MTNQTHSKVPATGVKSDGPTEFAEVSREFAEMLPNDIPEADRRRFLKLMGASLALAGASGCHPANPTWPRWPKANILPYAHRPEGQNPGTPLHYATMMEVGGVAKPVLAKSYDGRPIKIEGNPDHAASLGAADLFTQASILEMYDPERSPGVARYEGGHETATSWGAFLGELGPVLGEHRNGGGQGLRVLCQASSSPSLMALQSRMASEMPQAKWHSWEPVSRDNELDGCRLAFGQAVRPQYRLDQAQVIVSLDDDFLFAHPNAVRHSSDFAANRRADDGHMSRLFVVESAFSLTGSNADVRVPRPAGSIAQFAWALAAQLVLHEHVALPGGMEGLEPMLRQAASHAEHLPQIARMAKDLAAAQERALVTAGPAQPAGVHALAHVLNAALGGAGHTVDYTQDPAGARPSHTESIRELTTAMNGAQVGTLIILGGNPVYDAPADLDFAAALGKVARSAHLALFRNETSQACQWHLPQAHALEAWSDARSWDGTHTLAQPLIAPLYGGRTAAETMTALLDGHSVSGEKLTRAAFHRESGQRDLKAWRRATHDGFVVGSAGAVITASLELRNWQPSPADMDHTEPSGNSVEVNFRPDGKAWDGRYFGNASLQELPDPMTKLTWDNAALVAPTTARDLGVGMGDVISLTSQGRTVEAPVFLMPGQPAGAITLPLGYGRNFDGRMAERDKGDRPIGFNAYTLRTSADLHFQAGVQVAATGAHHELVTTQGHHVIEGVDNQKQIDGQAERLGQLYREASVEHYRDHPEFARHVVHHPPLKSLWEEHTYDTGYKWGMTIDLAACNGCSACVMACQAENNIPVTGKAEVARGREMHWIRIDRYFKDDSDSPAVAHQPLTCHQCENAPCEQVCPVAATSHSDEGLNDMVYNRCVGTRYCSNNCPYKVRRFNYFNNYAHVEDTTKMQHNPNVTVRSRGVMEKCTYCVQRIKSATIPAKNEGRTVLDGEITPACAQTCPTNAITFGDLNDPGSRVRKAQDHPRAYAMLGELNVKPRTNYLANITNTGGDAIHGGATQDGGHANGNGTHGQSDNTNTSHRG